MAVGGILARETDGSVTQTGPGTAGDVLTSNGAGAVPTFQAPGSGPVASAFPLVISSDFTVSAGTGVVVPESIEIAPGIVLEIGAGARLELTGPVASLFKQMVSLLSSAVNTGSTQIPADDTIPQSNEGDEYMTLAITPTSATSTLEISAKVMLSNATASRTLIATLFRDSEPDALTASIEFCAAAAGIMVLPITYTMTAGTTDSITFKIRGGSNASGTITFNGFSSARIFGTIPKSSMVIKEYAA